MHYVILVVIGAALGWFGRPYLDRLEARVKSSWSAFRGK